MNSTVPAYTCVTCRERYASGCIVGVNKGTVDIDGTFQCASCTAKDLGPQQTMKETVRLHIEETHNALAEKASIAKQKKQAKKRAKRRAFKKKCYEKRKRPANEQGGQGNNDRPPT